MIAINLEELKIIISADIAKAIRPVAALKKEINSVAANKTVNIGVKKSGGFTNDLQNLQATLADIENQGSGLGQAIATGLSVRIPEATALVISNIRKMRQEAENLRGVGGGRWLQAGLLTRADSLADMGKMAAASKLEDFSGKLTDIGAKAWMSKEGVMALGSAFAGLAAEASAALAPIISMLGSLAPLIFALAPILAGMALVGIGKGIDALTAKAVAYDSALVNLNYTLGESADMMQEWIDKSAMGLGMSKQTAQSYASQLSILTKSFTNSAQDNAVATANLINSAAIVASKTGRTTEDVMERFRSGMLGNTESIEDIGIQVGQKAIEQTAAFKGLGVAYDELLPAQKQYLYYQAIIAQTEANYGNAVANGPALRSAQFKAALEDLKLTLSTAFLPIATTVLPWITKMIVYMAAAAKMAVAFATTVYNAIASVFKAIGSFFSIKSKSTATKDVEKSTEKAKENTWGMSKGLGAASAGAGGISKNLGSAAKSAKQIRKTLAGFDEINNLGAKPTAADSGGAGGGAGGVGGGGGSIPALTMDMPEIDTDFPTIDEAIENIKERWKRGLKNIRIWWGNFWNPTFWKIKWQEFQIWFSEKWAALVNFIKPYWEKFTKWMGTKWDEIKQIYSNIKAYFQQKWADATSAIKVAFGGIAIWFATKWTEIKTKFSGVKEYFRDKFGDGYQAVKDAFKNIGSFFGDIWEDRIKPKITNIGRNFGSAIGGAFKGALNGTMSKVQTFFNGFTYNINKAIRVINKIPGVEIPLVNYIQIPKLAKGGVVGSGQIYQAGERGKEAIVPLENNTEWIGKVAAQMASQMGGIGNSDRPLTVILKVGETEFGRVSCNSINALIKQEGAIPLAI